MLGNALVLIAAADSPVRLKVTPGFDLAGALGDGRLAYVARGEAPLGIVYQPDAQAEKRVRVVGVFPEDSHPPITYPVALTVSARPEAARLADFLTGETARQIFMRYGFAPLPPR